eukprot:gene7891-12359_t
MNFTEPFIVTDQSSNCEICEYSTVTCICDICDVSFCDNCFSTHHKPKKLQNHKKRLITEKKKIKFCEQHQKPYEFFCHKEQQEICIKCAVSSHKNHDYISIEELLQKYKLEIKKKSEQKLADLKKKVEKNEKEFEAIKMKYDYSINELNEFQLISNSIDSVNDLEKIIHCRKMFDEEFSLKPYLYPIGIGDTKKNFTYYHSLAEKGDAAAQYYVSYCYSYGYGVKKDTNSYKKWLSKSLKQEYAGAILTNALETNNITQDEKMVESFQKIKELADKGDSLAQFIVSACLKVGLGCQKDFKSMIDYATLAADQSSIEGLIFLYFCYDSGNGVPKDKKKADGYLKMAADLGDSLAQFYLGISYRDFGNKQLSLKYLKMASDQGLSEASQEFQKLNK